MDTGIALDTCSNNIINTWTYANVNFFYCILHTCTYVTVCTYTIYVKFLPISPLALIVTKVAGLGIQRKLLSHTCMYVVLVSVHEVIWHTHNSSETVLVHPLQEQTSLVV